MTTTETRKYTPDTKVDIVQHFDSTIGGRTYLYGGLKSWENSPLRTYDNLDSVVFPTVTLGRVQDRGFKESYTAFDFVVSDPRFPKILVTSEHNKLLYECQNGLLPQSNRRLINLDAHDDFCMTNFPDSLVQEITIGNWGSAGYETKYWKDFVHLSTSPFGIRPYHSSGRPGEILITRGRKSVEYPFLQLSVDEWDNHGYHKGYLERLIKNKRYILSIDADAYALWDSPINQGLLGRLSYILGEVKEDENLDLIHLSLSPTHCLAENARNVWQQVNDALMGKSE